jgi:hypothetical protein
LVPAGEAPCWVGGQSRGIVALWVAAQGKNDDDAEHFVSGSWSGLGDDHSDADVPAEWIDGFIWISDDTPPVLWSATDVNAAQTMLTLDATFVRDILWADWRRWTDHATTTEDLMAELGVAREGRSAPPAGLVACR